MIKILEIIGRLYIHICQLSITLLLLLLLVFGGSVKIHIDFDSLNRFIESLKNYFNL